MRLSQREFRAMNNSLRRFVQRHVELRMMRSFGLTARGQDVLEIGSGSGYGAELLLEDRPRSYVGIDLMEEQIELARARGLAGARFEVMDAGELGAFDDERFDLVVVFGILHHIPAWRRVIAEIDRVLRPGGEVYLEEPDRATIERWDQLFDFRHQAADRLSLDALEGELEARRLLVLRRWRWRGLGVYRARKASRGH